MKKTIAKLLVFCMMVSMLAVPAMATDTVWTGVDLTFKADGTVTGTPNLIEMDENGVGDYWVEEDPYDIATSTFHIHNMPMGYENPDDKPIGGDIKIENGAFVHVMGEIGNNTLTISSEFECDPGDFDSDFSYDYYYSTGSSAVGKNFGITINVTDRSDEGYEYTWVDVPDPNISNCGTMYLKWTNTNQPEPITVTLDKSEVGLYVGRSTVLKATVTGSNQGVYISSSDTNIVTVNQNGNDATITAVAAGTATIKAVSNEDSRVSATCTVTVSNSGGNGGGGGGGGGSSSGSSSTTTPAGKTVTTDPKTGTSITTETATDGSKTVSSTATDGSAGTVKTDANGKLTEAAATVSEKAVADAEAKGGVTLPIEVPAADTAAEATAIKVTMPSSVSSGNKVDVEIPVTDVKPTTVAILVHEDGTEEIIKDAALTEDGLVVTAEGSFTVKIVDNAKSFSDSIPNWAKDAVDFVTARGIMNGTGDAFEADATTSRGMIAQIIFNFDRNSEAGVANTFSDVSTGDWFADAAAWCASKSIMNGTGDGFDGNAPVTREQFVTTLYRYAQAVGYDVSASATLTSFNDADSVSTYAQGAMAWAIGAGLINGMDGGLNPQGLASRGQIAAVMARFCNSVAH